MFPNPELPLFGVTLLQPLLVAVVGGGAAVLGGVTGYGTGLILPLVLVPTVGAEATVPIIGAASILNNVSRLYVFRQEIQWRLVGFITLISFPFCLAGAYFYSQLSGPWATTLIGAMLMALVPAKRLLKRSGVRLRSTSLGFASAGFGVLIGSTAGSGIVLLSILMAAGLSGRAVVATDATVSFLLGIAKTGVFHSTGVLTPAAWAMALVVGVIAVPAAFVAKWLTERISVRIHDLIIETMIFLGGALLVWRGLSELWLRTSGI